MDAVNEGIEIEIDQRHFVVGVLLHDSNQCQARSDAALENSLKEASSAVNLLQTLFGNAETGRDTHAIPGYDVAAHCSIKIALHTTTAKAMTRLTGNRWARAAKGSACC